MTRESISTTTSESSLSDKHHSSTKLSTSLSDDYAHHQASAALTSRLIPSAKQSPNRPSNTTLGVLKHSPPAKPFLTIVRGTIFATRYTCRIGEPLFPSLAVKFSEGTPRVIHSSTFVLYSSSLSLSLVEYLTSCTHRQAGVFFLRS